MGFSLSALQFGKELLEVKSEAKEKEFCLNVGLSPHQEAFEFAIALEYAECPLYLNGSIHPEKRSFLGKKISFFRGGYFATASMIYPRASCRVVLK